MRLSTQFILITMLTSCGPPLHHGDGWPTELNGHMNEFFLKAGKYHKVVPAQLNYGLSVSFVDGIADGPQGQTVLAQCERFGGESNERSIIIAKYEWIRRSEAGQRMVLFHELGHCLFDYEHDNSYNSSLGYPMSIMNSYSFDEFWFAQNYENYLKQFFTGEYGCMGMSASDYYNPANHCN